MKLKSIIPWLALLAIPLSHLQAQEVTQLSDLTWKNRILVVHPQNASDLSNLWQKLEAAEEAVNERKIQVMATWRNSVRLFPESNLRVSPEALVRLLMVQQADYLLIGLDGSVKLKAAGTPPNLEQVFTLIDSMPMRQSELSLSDFTNPE